MRIRSIKPEFWRSNDISALSVEDRLLFIGLWSYVDDNGVGVDKLSSITADLFADDLERDPSETFARVSRGLQHLSEAGRIIRYTLDNRDYLEVINWTRHQRIDRPNKPRLPHHDAEGTVIREGVASVSRESSAWNRGTGEQGNRGTDSASKNAPKKPVRTPKKKDDDAHNTDPDFAQFWEAYPLKKDKKRAHESFLKALEQVDLATLIQGAKNYANDPARNPDATKHPTTWLNGNNWEDQPGYATTPRPFNPNDPSQW